MFWDRNGQPMELMAWAKAYGDFEGRVVKRTPFGEFEVLTVWLGTADYEEDPPLIYGTIMRDGGRKYHHETRSATEADALVAHANLERLLLRMPSDAQKARIAERVLAKHEAAWRERVGDAAYEEALEYWRTKFASES